MNYTTLGNAGLVVSRLAFGAMTFTAGNKDIGSVFKVGAELADQLVGRSLDAGINFFDTADGYAAEESEMLLGQALKTRRQDVVIATKVGFRSARRSRRRGCRDATSCGRSTRACGGLAPIGSTSTLRIARTLLLRSRKRSQRSTPS